jgi:HD-GYP domain-containing protein (c-di-GMP phosphodiesterase class II)
MDSYPILVRWRHRPAAVALSLAGVTLAITAVLVAVGGPPSPLTHLYYAVVIAAAMLWGPAGAAAIGGACGVLADPITRALLGHPLALENGWFLRSAAMMLVGWVCGNLTSSLLRRVSDLQTLNMETISAFVRAIDARDPYTARHSEKVAAYAVQLARALGLGPERCERIRLAGLLHDVGKVGLERSILHKPGALSDQEWRQVRDHPRLSAHIIGGVTQFAPFLAGARHHHERFDGRGYPDNLAGTDIPLDARILAVADAFDAMTSDRSYRPALSHEEAKRRLLADSGTHFDPECVAAFVALELDLDAVDDVLAPIMDLPAVGTDGGQARSLAA